MLYRSFFASLLLFTGLPAQAYEFESTDALKASVESFLHATLLAELDIEDPTNLKVSASNLDTRLKLKKCEGNIQHHITSPKPYASNLSVKVSCDSNQRWSIYVPSQVSVFDDIVVLDRSLSRGDVILKTDLSLSRRDITSVGSGYIKEPSRVVGMQLKRRLNTGQAIRLSHVTAAKVIKKGDKVVLEASGAGLSVVTSALALSGGSVGQQIQVQNSHSKRIIDAKIVGPGRVAVLL